MQVGKDSPYFLPTGFPFPLEPALNRKTIRYEVVPNTIWTFEQEQGEALFWPDALSVDRVLIVARFPCPGIGFGLNVSTNVRMTVIKLKSGGLWVHAPVAPTRDCIAMLKEIGAPVEYIVLPTFAYEHKVFVGPFARQFPKVRPAGLDMLASSSRDFS